MSNNSQLETTAPATPWHVQQLATKITGMDAILTLRRSPPLGGASLDSMIPERQKKLDEITASPPAVRYREVLSGLADAEKQIENFRAKALAAAVRLSDVAMTEGGDVLIEAQIARDAAMDDFRQAREMAATLREAAEGLHDQLGRDLAAAQDQLRGEVGQGSDRRALLAEMVATISEQLDKLARLDDRQTRGRLITLPNVDSLLGAVPPKPADVECLPPAGFFTGNLSAAKASPQPAAA